MKEMCLNSYLETSFIYNIIPLYTALDFCGQLIDSLLCYLSCKSMGIGNDE